MFILYYLLAGILVFVVLYYKFKFTKYKQTKIGIVAALFFPITLGGILLLYILEIISNLKKSGKSN